MMKIQKTDSYYSIAPSDKELLSDDRGFEIFFNAFVKKISTFKNINLILDFSGLINIDLNKILLFSQISESHKKNKKSFVIVCQGIAFDQLPDELIAVPTFKEAEDIIEIEDIERDLGI
jgi:hypothetical protein